MIDDPHDVFDSGWLAERFAFDAQARNPEVTARAQSLTPQNPQRWHLVDIGSGLGANVRHTAPTLAGPQRWHLIEHNPTLSAQSLRALARWAQRLGWAHHHQAQNTLHIHRPSGPLEITAVQGSFVHLDTLVNLPQTDIVTAGAVFDLLTDDQLDHMIAMLKRAATALWATLNYTGTAFEPIDPDDAHFVALYEAHMRRPRPEGASMGPDCAAQMVQRLRACGFEVTEGPSVWRIPAAAAAMQDHMRSFFAHAVPEVPGCDPQVFARWQGRRWPAPTLLVSHSDLLAIPR